MTVVFWGTLAARTSATMTDVRRHPVSRHGSHSAPTGARVPGPGDGAASAASRARPQGRPQRRAQGPVGRPSRSVEEEEGGVRAVLIRAAELSACCVTSFVASLLLVMALVAVAFVIYSLSK